MHEFVVKLHEGIAPARLGMTRAEIRGALGEPSHAQEACEKWGIRFPSKDFFYRNAFQVSYDGDVRAVFIEVASESGYVVTFDGVDVHNSAPQDVIAAIECFGEVDREQSEYPVNRWYPSLQINLYREHSDKGRFDTVGVSTASIDYSPKATSASSSTHLPACRYV